MQEAKEKHLIGLENEITKAIDETEPLELVVTNRVMRSVFFAVDNYFSFNTHEELMDLMEANGVDIGDHCRSGYISKEMTKAISLNIRDEFIQAVKECTCLSLILDASSDRTQSHYVSTLFMVQKFFYITVHVLIDHQVSISYFDFLLLIYSRGLSI